MTEQGQDRSDQAVEESLHSWAASSEAPTGWVPPSEVPPRAADQDTIPTAVHAAGPAAPEPIPPTPTPTPAPEPLAPLPVEPLPIAPSAVQPAGVEYVTVDPATVDPATVDQSSSGGGSPRAVAVAKLAAERPELVIAGAFVGGLLLATILKRLAR